MVRVSRNAIKMMVTVAAVMALMTIISAGMVQDAYADSDVEAVSNVVETVYVNGTGLETEGDCVKDDNNEGTATLNYDAKGDPVLTLDGFNCQINIYQGSAIGYHGNKELTIILKGESSLTTTDNTRCSIQTNHSLRIKGSGTLSLSCNENLSSYSGIESDYGDITIDDNCNVTVHSKSKDYGYGLNARNGSVTVNSGCITAITANASETCIGIRADEHVMIGENITKIEASGKTGAISGTVINKREGKGWDDDQSQSSAIGISLTGQSLSNKNVLFEAELYDLWIGGTQVTSANDDDIKDSVIKSGKVSFDKESRTLTLKDTEISGEGQDLTATILTKYKDLTVSLEGDNTIQDNPFAILVVNSEADSSLTITGSGSLNAYGMNDGIEANTVIIDDKCSLTASGSTTAIDGKVKNAAPGRGWTNEEGTGEAVRIAPSTTAVDLREYKKLVFIPELKVTGTLIAQMKSSGKTSLVVTWTRAKGAEGYDIYFAKNGKKFKKSATVTADKKLKWTKKKLKKSVAYKAYVKAWIMKDGVKKYVKTSPTVYAYTSKGTKKYTNPKSVKVKKTKYTLAAGKTAKIKATVTKLKKSKKLKKFARNPRFISSNKAVATVNKYGKITTKATGTCKIYAYATNGVRKKISVTVYDKM